MTLGLSLIVAALMAVASVAGLVVDDLYRQGVAVDAALRGADLVNLLVAPGLVVATLAARRGSARAQLIWCALLAYTVYTYGYYVFVPSFNDGFLLHVAVFAGAAVALVGALIDLDVAGISQRFGARTPARTVAVLLLVVAGALVWNWGSASLRFALSGEPPTDILPAPEWRVHLGYVMDLAVLMPAALVAGLLLWRRRRWGYVAATVVSVWVFVSQLNFVGIAVFMADAGVEDVSAADPAPYASAVLFLIPTVLLLANLRGAPIPVEAPVDRELHTTVVG